MVENYRTTAEVAERYRAPVAEKHLTTEEVAERYRTSPETIRYWRHRGKGPRSWKAGRRVLYRESDLLAFEHEQTAKG